MSTLIIIIKKGKKQSSKEWKSNRTKGESANARHAAFTSAGDARQAASGITGAVRIKKKNTRKIKWIFFFLNGGETWRLQSGYEMEEIRRADKQEEVPVGQEGLQQGGGPVWGSASVASLWCLAVRLGAAME